MIFFLNTNNTNIFSTRISRITRIFYARFFEHE